LTTSVAFSGILLAAVAAPAAAQPKAPVTEQTKDSARNSYRAGELKFKEGNYSLALEYYMQAEAILPVWATKYKIAVCNDRLNRPAEAVKWYQAFLDANPPDKVAADITDARARIAVLGKAVATSTGSVQILVNPPNAPNLTASVDGGPPQAFTGSLTLSPGRHRVVVTAAGYGPATSDVDVTAGGAARVNVQLAPVAGGGQTGGGQTGGGQTGGGQTGGGQTGGGGTGEMVKRSNVPSYVLFGVTGVGAVLGGVFGAMALSSKNAFNSHPRGDNSDASAAQTNAHISTASFVVAGVAGVVGIILIATNKPHPATTGQPVPASKRAFVTPYAGPIGAGVAF
jgi:hypothetical protein